MSDDRASLIDKLLEPAYADWRLDYNCGCGCQESIEKCPFQYRQGEARFIKENQNAHREER